MDILQNVSVFLLSYEPALLRTGLGLTIAAGIFHIGIIGFVGDGVRKRDGSYGMPLGMWFTGAAAFIGLLIAFAPALAKVIG